MAAGANLLLRDQRQRQRALKPRALNPASRDVDCVQLGRRPRRGWRLRRSRPRVDPRARRRLKQVDIGFHRDCGEAGPFQ
ncbi:hypothetical protein GLA29479_399 [Lysobacter antibioticus]|nr:hypothetical protein GLA29479_399 [Lysobacter antibioticus]